MGHSLETDRSVNFFDQQALASSRSRQHTFAGEALSAKIACETLVLGNGSPGAAFEELQ